eukprot:6899371-Prymnesium_polylepis.2
MAPKKPAAVSLKAGDRVSVETRDWKAGRTYGEVLHKDKTGKWVCNFAEKDGANVAWSRSALRFEKRAKAPKQTAPAAEGGGKAAGKESAAPAAPPVDSSDEE